MADAVAYEVLYNADLTEGRGPMESMGFFRTEEEVEIALGNKKFWIMGAQHNHEVYEIRIPINPHMPASRTQVFGYREHLLGKKKMFGRPLPPYYGWLDFRDVPKVEDDPEYSEYVRLKEKFE